MRCIDRHDRARRCEWCGSESGCDCVDRMLCDKTGTPGHLQCGTKPCGCPVFYFSNHSNKCQEVRNASR